MRLTILRSLWTNGLDLDAALADCRSGSFDGVEGPVPSDSLTRREFAARLRDAGVPFVAEIATGGGYIPGSGSPEEHLDDFRRLAEASLDCAPLFLTVLAGSDRWGIDESASFFEKAADCSERLGAIASFETHRSRPTFNPWATRDLLDRVPRLRLTCDFSHWCCVCERLVLDEEPAILGLCASRAHHIHARVGYAQGPQVPHPGAPGNARELEAHERWWEAILSAQAGRGAMTFTPEFGPDGYLHTYPFTNAPVADLNEVNRWMAKRLRRRFGQPKQPPATGAP